MPKGIGIKHFTPMESGVFYNSWLVLGPRERRGNTMFWLCTCQCKRTHQFVKGADLRAERSKQCRQCVTDGNTRRQSKTDTAFNQLFQRYRSGARTRGIAWDLSEEEFRQITSAPCFYTGRPPQSVLVSLGGSKYTYNSIDRVDSSQGYTVANCVACYSPINMMKGTMSIDAFFKLIGEIFHFKKGRHSNVVIK